MLARLFLKTAALLLAAATAVHPVGGNSCVEILNRWAHDNSISLHRVKLGPHWLNEGAVGAFQPVIEEDTSQVSGRNGHMLSSSLQSYKQTE